MQKFNMPFHSFLRIFIPSDTPTRSAQPSLASGKSVGFLSSFSSFLFFNAPAVSRYRYTCPRQEVSGNTSGEFVMRTDFLPYVLRTPVFRILLAWDKYIPDCKVQYLLESRQYLCMFTFYLLDLRFQRGYAFSKRCLHLNC